MRACCHHGGECGRIWTRAGTGGAAAGRGTPRPPLLDKDHLRFQPEDAEAGGAIFVGDFYDRDKMISIKEGGMMYHPTGLHHYDGAKAETGDVTVQITGIGPVGTVQSEVDVNGQPTGAAARGAAAPAAGRGTAPGRQ